MIIRLLIVLLIGCSGSAMAQNAKLKGWGPFTFGMSQAQALQIAGAKAIMKNNPIGNFSYPAEIEGRKFEAVLFFNAKGGYLVDIELRHEDANSLKDDQCVAESDAISGILEKKYGSFTTVRRGETSSLINKGEKEIWKSKDFSDGKLILLTRHGTSDPRFTNCLISVTYRPAQKAEKQSF